MTAGDVTFRMADLEAEEWFLRNYLQPAWERFQARESFERGWFLRVGRHARHDVPAETLDGGRVFLVVDGDFEAFVRGERDRWAALEDDGRLEGWEIRPYEAEGYEDLLAQQRESFGERGGEIAYRLKPIAAEASLALMDALGERVPAVGTPTEDNPKPVNFWNVLHYLMNQNGYDWYDEIAACTQVSKSRLKSLGDYAGEEAAQKRLQETVAELEAFSGELSEWLAEQRETT